MHFRWSQELLGKLGMLDGHVGIHLGLLSIIAAIVLYGPNRVCAGPMKSRTAIGQMLIMSNGIAVES